MVWVASKGKERRAAERERAQYTELKLFAMQKRHATTKRKR